MASIQQIRAVEREIRANKELLERERSALNESLSKKSKLDSQIKNILRERAEKISRLESEANGLRVAIKIEEQISISIQQAEIECENSIKRERYYKISSEIRTIEQEMNDKFGALELPASAYVKSFLIGFSVFYVSILFIAKLTGNSFGIINPSLIILLCGFGGFLSVVITHQIFDTFDSKLTRLKRDLDCIKYTQIIPKPAHDLHDRLNDLESKNSQVSYKIDILGNEKTDVEKESQNLDIKIKEHKKNIDHYLAVEKSLTTKKFDLEQDMQDIDDEKEKEFMDTLMRDARRKKALLNVDLEGMKDSLMNQAQVDHYKLRLIDEMQRKLRDQKFSDVDAIIQQMKALGLRN